MTVEAPAATFLEVCEAELAEGREQLVPLVMRLDALSDLRHHALAFRDGTGREPTYDDLLDAAPDEIARAELIALGRRLTRMETQE